MLSSSPRGFYLRRVLSRHSSHWNIHKRDESRQTLAILSPKPRNGCSHFKRPSILLAQDFLVCERPGRTSECSSPQAGAKIAFMNEYARDLVVCLIVPGKLLLAQISVVGFVGWLFSWRCSAIFKLIEQLETVVTQAQLNANKALASNQALPAQDTSHATRRYWRRLLEKAFPRSRRQ